MRKHCSQRLDDRCPGLYNPRLTGGLMWSRSSVASPSSVIARRLGSAGVVAWVRRNSCWIKLKVIHRHCCLVVLERLLG